MKKSTHRLSTQRWDNFAAGSNAPEDDFLLADLQTIPDDTGLTITPLNHIADDEEDAIDRLLADSGFDTDTEPAQTANKRDALVAAEPVIEPVNLVDHPAGPVADTPADEQNDAAFVVDPLHEEPLTETEAIIPADFQVDTFISDYLATRQPDPSLNSEAESSLETTASNNEPGMRESIPQRPDDGISAEHVANAIMSLIAKEPIVQRKKPEPLQQGHATDAVLDNAGVAQDHTTNPANDASILQQLEINQAHLEKQLARLQRQSSTAMRIAYASLAVGIAILASAAVLYTVTSGMKADIAKLAESVEILKEGREAAILEAPDEL